MEFFLPFFIGLAGSLHCIGMCGPIVVAYSLNAGAPTSTDRRVWPSSALYHLAFHAGRITTYALLGVFAAFIVEMTGLMPYLKNSRGVFSLIAGSVMIVLASGFLGFSFIPAFQSAGKLPAVRFINSPTLVSKYLLGLSVGFLPCMLPWAMVMKASSSQNVFHGFLTMVLFGIGTIPALFFTGFFASFLSLRLRLIGERLAGISIMVMGAILIFKGLKYFW